MPLGAGTRIGAYEVTGLLGVGGPAAVRATARELRRGLAEAKEARCT